MRSILLTGSVPNATVAEHPHFAGERYDAEVRDEEPTAISLNGQPADDQRIAAVYRCRLQLDQLQDTDHPEIKHCGVCRRSVVKVEDFDGFERAVAMKGCVWGPINVRSSAVEPKDSFLGGAHLMDYAPAGALK